MAGVSKPTDWLVPSESKKTGRSTELAERCEALGVACSGAVEETLRIDGRRVIVLLRLTNCALDGSEGTLVPGVVESLQTDDDGDPRALVRWDNGARSSVTTSSDGAVERQVQDRFSPATLGFTWTRRR